MEKLVEWYYTYQGENTINDCMKLQIEEFLKADLNCNKG